MARHNTTFRGPRPLTMPQQQASLAARWPNLVASTQGRMCHWQGWLRPSELSLEYKVRVEYEPPRYPRAFVDEPPLQRRPQEPDRPIPHVWSDPVIRPCLFKLDQWRFHHPLDRVVDWLAEWLFFYEIWQTVGVWKGGGEHITRKAEDSVSHSKS